MSSPPVDIELRDMLPSDRNYVLSSWIRSYAAKSRDAHDYPHDVVPEVERTEEQDAGGQYLYVERPKLHPVTGQPLTRSVLATSFFEDFAPVVSDLIDRSRVVIASMREKPDIILGWMAIEDDALHYLLVKPRWRRLGVARWMVSDMALLPVVYTHRTSDSMKCPIPASWTYRRFRAWPRRAHETAASAA